MTAVSFSVVHGTEANVADGSDVTQGTQAPSAGDIEVRITTGTGITQRNVYDALEKIWRFLADPVVGTGIQPTP